MSGSHDNPLTRWALSEEGQLVLHQRALANLQLIQSMPRCGAKAKSTGSPCRQPGSGRGGRCVYHGGKSTAGETWGLRQWSDSTSPVVARRQMDKAKKVERAVAEREQRLAAMPPDERARYDAWLRAHAPGPQDGRVGAKMLAALGLVPAASSNDMTIAQMQARLVELKAEKRAWEAHCAQNGHQGVFG